MVIGWDRQRISWRRRGECVSLLVWCGYSSVRCVRALLPWERLLSTATVKCRARRVGKRSLTRSCFWCAMAGTGIGAGVEGVGQSEVDVEGCPDRHTGSLGMARELGWVI